MSDDIVKRLRREPHHCDACIDWPVGIDESGLPTFKDGLHTEAAAEIERLRAEVGRAYALLWRVMTDDQRVHQARKLLLGLLTKEQQHAALAWERQEREDILAPAQPESRSVQRRKAAQRGEPAPTFANRDDTVSDVLAACPKCFAFMPWDRWPEHCEKCTAGQTSECLLGDDGEQMCNLCAQPMGWHAYTDEGSICPKVL